MGYSLILSFDRQDQQECRTTKQPCWCKTAYWTDPTGFKQMVLQ